MNREMILRVADAIEEAAKPEAKPPMGFNMSSVRDEKSAYRPDKTGHSCGTVGCIAGWAISIQQNFSSLDWIPLYYDDWITEAAGILGLDRRDAFSLFHAEGSSGEEDDGGLLLGEITPDQAVTVLRHLAETGRVDWSVAAEARP